MCALRCALRGLRVRLRCANPRAPHGIGAGLGRHVSVVGVRRSPWRCAGKETAKGWRKERSLETPEGVVSTAFLIVLTHKSFLPLR